MGLERDCEIIQIGAVHQRGHEFNQFIIPTGRIDPEATEVNGFSKHHGNLYHHGRIIEDAVAPARGLQVSILYKTFLVTTHIYARVREAFSGKPCIFKKD